jgi:hypothetical protein
MRDKYLGKDGITEKYDFMGNIINCGKKGGIILGGLYSITRIVSEDVKGIFFGAGFAAISYFGGNYISKMNEKKKEKALKNLESKTAA